MVSVFLALDSATPPREDYVHVDSLRSTATVLSLNKKKKRIDAHDDSVKST